ncbi:MAG: CYTH domain-containing protein [Pasteurellaceae bacterium]|nr:CYTH domain-containing protein [Pasteurellaceae bacterium]
MSQEIELKFEVSPEFATNLPQRLQHCQILEQGSQFLANCYYDTPDQYFAKQKMGLRVRKQQEQYEMTLKTQGNVIGGLHIRPEYNVMLTHSQPDLALFSQFDELNLPSELVLQPLFSTDFMRQNWLVDYQGAQIEIALDQGTILAGERTVPILEVELELKQGQLADLLAFVDNELCADGMRVSNLSKAQRGYRLANKVSDTVVDWLAKWKKISELNAKTADKNRLVFLDLAEFEQQLLNETCQLGETFFAQQFLRTVERIGTFYHLFQYYLEQGKLLSLLQQEKGLSEALLAESWQTLGLLSEKFGDIMRTHSLTKDNSKAMLSLIDLVNSAEYVRHSLQWIKFSVE